MNSTALQTLRDEIDSIDAEIVHLLGKRFRVTAAVGQLKARHALAPVDAARESAQEARFRSLAEEHGVDPELTVALFRLVIDEVVRNHRKA